MKKGKVKLKATKCAMADPHIISSPIFARLCICAEVTYLPLASLSRCNNIYIYLATKSKLKESSKFLHLLIINL